MEAPEFHGCEIKYSSWGRSRDWGGVNKERIFKWNSEERRVKRCPSPKPIIYTITFNDCLCSNFGFAVKFQESESLGSLSSLMFSFYLPSSRMYIYQNYFENGTMFPTCLSFTISCSYAWILIIYKNITFIIYLFIFMILRMVFFP